jgi:hypothetical protein
MPVAEGRLWPLVRLFSAGKGSRPAGQRGHYLNPPPGFGSPRSPPPSSPSARRWCATRAWGSIAPSAGTRPSPAARRRPPTGSPRPVAPPSARDAAASPAPPPQARWAGASSTGVRARAEPRANLSRKHDEGTGATKSAVSRAPRDPAAPRCGGRVCSSPQSRGSGAPGPHPPARARRSGSELPR